ncbi:MAG: HAD-IA family hydrolase [Bacteroidaceae bacterium]|nr:HAD-IA family hydrolase [Bacteroidaceae bacterium]
MQSNKPLASLFDLDGVVLDTEGQYSVFWGGVGRKYTDIVDFEHKIKGMTLTQILDGNFSDENLKKEIVAQLIEFEKNMDFPYINGVEQYIKEIKRRGVKLAVVTSSDKSKMESVYRTHPELMQYFDRILVAEDFARSKPFPDCYLLGASVFDTVIENCVVYEDSVNGLKAGKSANMKVVGLSTTNPTEVVAPLSDIVIPDFADFTYEKMIELIK